VEWNQPNFLKGLPSQGCHAFLQITSTLKKAIKDGQLQILSRGLVVKFLQQPNAPLTNTSGLISRARKDTATAFFFELWFEPNAFGDKR